MAGQGRCGIDDWKRKRIIRMNREGFKKSHIARNVGCSPITVTRVIESLAEGQAEEELRGMDVEEATSS